MTINEQLFEKAFNNAPIGMALVALDGRWIRVNRSVCRIVGYDEATLLQKTFQDITYPPDLAVDLSYVQQLLSGSIDSYQMEKRYIRSDGELVWVRLSVSLARDSRNKPGMFISQIEDINAAKLAEQELKLQEQRWHFALESANHGVWDWNIQAGEVFYSNGWKKMLGYDEHEVGNSPTEWTDRGHPDDRQRATAELVRHWRGETDTYVCEHRVRCKDGNYKWILDRGKVVAWTAEKKPRRMVGTYTDLTDIRDAQRLLAEQARQLSRVNGELERRNNELQRFTRMASHDLREPLRNISGFTSLIKKHFKSELTAEESEYFSFVDAGVRRMDEMIRALGEMARLDQFPIAQDSFPLRKVVEDALDNLDVEVAESQAEIVIGELPRVAGSRTLIVQLMQHVLSNALKYRRELPPKVEIQCAMEAGEQHVTISDTGIGIPPKDMPVLFEPFRGPAHNGMYAGTSVGLTFSKRIVERHGGRIWIESMPGTGTTVHFTLPMLTEVENTESEAAREERRRLSDRRVQMPDEMEMSRASAQPQNARA